MTDGSARSAGWRRRDVLVGGGALSLAGALPARSRVRSAEPRFVLVVLEGGFDGLSAVPAVGDPSHRAARGALAEDPGARPLDEVFALHSRLPMLETRFRAGDALVVHAAASPYRGRSHEEARAVLASGLHGPGESGWLNRAAAAWLPAGPDAACALVAMSEGTPLEARGPAPALVCRPESAGRVGPEQFARLVGALAGGSALQVAAGGPLQVAVRSRPREEESAAALARLVAMPLGPRVAVITLSGWDMHAAQAGAGGAMARRLDGLDRVLAALCEGLAPVWSDTVIAVVSEFGRSVQPNGAGGTEHGLATAVFVLGGAVRGGRVVADWPGLARDSLVAGALRPTVDLRAVLKGILHDHGRIPAQQLAGAIFPGSDGVPPMSGLIR